jgi:hypothetical protein
MFFGYLPENQMYERSNFGFKNLQKLILFALLATYTFQKNLFLNLWKFLSFLSKS